MEYISFVQNLYLILAFCEESLEGTERIRISSAVLNFVEKCWDSAVHTTLHVPKVPSGINF